MAIIGTSLTVAGTSVGSSTGQSTLRVVSDNINIGAGQVADNEYIVSQLPAESRVTMIQLLCTGVTGATIDIGLYRSKSKNAVLPTEFEAIDDNYFATSVDISSPLLGSSNFVLEATTGRIIEFARRPFSQEFADALESRNHLYIGFKFITVDAAATGRIGFNTYYGCVNN